MKISIGFDHGAIELRAPIVELLKARGDEVLDHGTHSADSVDYPDYASKVAHDVAEARADAGILCCTTGIGMCIAANKVKGIRAANIHYDDEARLTRLHNHANILCLGALHITPKEARRLVEVFLDTPYEHGSRHDRRVEKIAHAEQDRTE